MVTTPSPLASICENMPTTAVSILRKVSVSILISISASHTAVSQISGSISSMISSAVGGGGGGGGGGIDGSTQGLKYDSFTLYLCPLNSDFGLICLSKNFGSLSPSLSSHGSTSCATSPTASTTPLLVLTSLIISTLERIAGFAGEPWPDSPISPGIQRGESGDCGDGDRRTRVAVPRIWAPRRISRLHAACTGDRAREGRAPVTG
mmetsp:Transcript_6495/g.29662  ORF Transcript_6495/g.29662 Transcript_6495/m.29662 type:complete len:206 (+) Transcript_6495:2594-3211(+)